MILEVEGGLGDELVSTAIIREYKRQFPDEMIRVLEPGRPELFLHNPYLNVGKSCNGKRHKLRLDLGRSDKGGNGAHAHAAQLGIQINEDTPEIWLTQEEREATKWEHVIVPENHTEQILQVVDSTVPRPERSVCIDPGAGWESKRWAIDRWRELAGRLLEDGWDVYEIGRAMAGEPPVRLPATRSLTNKTTIREAAVFISRCALFLGHESGLMHLAAAVGTPQVIVYGHTKFADYGYYNAVPVFPYSSCGENCYQQCYREPKVRGRFSHCMDEISVDRVHAAVSLAARRFPYLPIPSRPENRLGVIRREVQKRLPCSSCGEPA